MAIHLFLSSPDDAAVCADFRQRNEISADDGHIPLAALADGRFMIEASVDPRIVRAADRARIWPPGAVWRRELPGVCIDLRQWMRPGLLPSFVQALVTHPLAAKVLF